MRIVSMTLSPPIRVFALIGALLATGMVAFVFVVGRDASQGALPAPATSAKTPAAQTTTAPKVPPKPAVAKPQATTTKSGFPVPVDRALRRHGVVVIVVYLPRAAVDALVRTEARAAAITSRAGYVAISALNARLVGSLVARTGFLPDPAVVIVKRPGVVTSRLSVTDRETIAQAVAQARR